jgi:hypothetical protein
MTKMGYPERGADRNWGYSDAFSPQGLSNARGRAWATEHFAKMEPWSLRFWYRESSEPLEHGAFSYGDYDDAPLQHPGEVQIQLDTEGHLREFAALPKQVEASVSPGTNVNWSALFSEAGLEQRKFTSSQRPWKPLFYADAYAAWDGSLPQAPDIPIRIEAAAYAGKPVYFHMTGPWNEPDAPDPDTAGRLPAPIGLSIFAAVTIASGFFVRRNVRLGRGDRRGALRLAIVFMALDTLVWVLREHHVTSLVGESRLFAMFVSTALVRAALVALFYLAMEPMIRRRWPETLIPWTRLLNGEWRDPLVGRDVLVGCAAGAAFASMNFLRAMTPQWLGEPTTDLFPNIPPAVLGPGSMLAALAEVSVGVFGSLVMLIAFFLLKSIFRKSWIATLAIAVVLEVIVIFWAVAPWPLRVQIPLIVLLFAFLSVRFGLLSMVVAFYVNTRLNGSALTFDTSAWYFPIGLINGLLIVALSCIAFRISLGGTRLLKDTED